MERPFYKAGDVVKNTESGRCGRVLSSPKGDKVRVLTKTRKGKGRGKNDYVSWCIYNLYPVSRA